jgi:hypothetical protein
VGIHRRQDDLISLFISFQKTESGPKIARLNFWICWHKSFVHAQIKMMCNIEI